MSVDTHVVNQRLRDFTIRVLDQKGEIAGTGFVISEDGRIATCAHVIRNVFDGKPPRDLIDREVTVYFPQARPPYEKQHTAVISACFPQHDDDVVLLKLKNASPLAPGKYARIYPAEKSDGNDFSSYGYRRLDKYQAGYATGKIKGAIEAPDDESWQAEPLQLSSSEIDKGMSGAAVLDMELNVVVGIVSQTWYANGNGKDRDTAFGVNAHVLTLPPLLIEAYTGELPFPREEGQTPKLTPEQDALIAAAPKPAAFDLSRAPYVLEEWVGRADLLKAVHDDYANPSIRVIGLIGYGGEGKTSLARKALDEIINGGNRPNAVFWWSFYEDRSADAFFESALTYFGGDPLTKSAGSASARAGYLASILRDRRAVIVLDGFEVMQHEDGDDYGAITSAALRDFLDMMATIGGQSCALVTSRAPLTDLIAHTSYHQHDVTRMSAADGRDLLRAVGVKGADDALDKLVERWDGHALTLSLIGSALRDMFGGDVAHADEIPPPTADESRYDRVKRVLRRYDEHLNDAERAFLMIFSAFRKPVRADAFAKIFRAATDKTTLNAPLTTLDDAAFDKLINGLTVRRLIRPVTESDGTTAYTAHPLIRAHYADRLHDRTDARAAHGQIAAYYKASVPQESEMDRLMRQLGMGGRSNPTLDDLAPYLEIVHHLCAAGAFDEAFQVHRERIDQGNRAYINNMLGAYETNLAIMIGFFPDADMSRDPAVSNPSVQRFILNAVGFCLMNLGRGRAAAPFYERSNRIAESMGDAHNASTGEQNLAELYANLGEINASAAAARRALDLSAQVMDERKRQQDERVSQVWLGWALHLSGDLPGAADAFARAEALEKALFGDQGVEYLYSNRGIHHADHLRRSGDPAYARRVTDANVKGCTEYGWTFLISQCHRVLGDLDADAGAHDSARGHYDQAVAIARKIDRIDVRIGALHGRGWWYAKHMKDAPAAFNDLNEALDFAVRGEYRIFEANIRNALAWAHLANGDTAQVRREAETAQAMSAQMGYHWGGVDAAEVLGRV